MSATIVLTEKRSSLVCSVTSPTITARPLRRILNIIFSWKTLQCLLLIGLAWLMSEELEAVLLQISAAVKEERYSSPGASEWGNGWMRVAVASTDRFRRSVCCANEMLSDNNGGHVENLHILVCYKLHVCVWSCAILLSLSLSRSPSLSLPSPFLPLPLPYLSHSLSASVCLSVCMSMYDCMCT